MISDTELDYLAATAKAGVPALLEPKFVLALIADLKRARFQRDKARARAQKLHNDLGVIKRHFGEPDRIKSLEDQLKLAKDETLHANRAYSVRYAEVQNLTEIIRQKDEDIADIERLIKDRFGVELGREWVEPEPVKINPRGLKYPVNLIRPIPNSALITYTNAPEPELDSEP
jgi:hypothetical protein